MARHPSGSGGGGEGGGLFLPGNGRGGEAGVRRVEPAATSCQQDCRQGVCSEWRPTGPRRSLPGEEVRLIRKITVGAAAGGYQGAGAAGTVCDDGSSRKGTDSFFFTYKSRAGGCFSA